MTEGTIVKWCFSEGDKLEAGDVLCEIQTDKAVVAMEIDDEAVLAKILVPEGESGIKINSLIALTVNLDQDWKDVTIPAQTSSEEDSEISVAGKSFSEALILASTNPQYDKKLFIDLLVQYMKTTSSEQVVSFCFDIQNIYVHNMS